jgi:protein-S-isoprenylcysteine O-methyltransferase Ste14
MTEPSQLPKQQEGVANPGWLRPPFVFVAAILAGITLDRLWPAALPGGLVLKIVGSGGMLAAMGLFVLAHRSMSRAGTPVPGNQPTVTIARSGPFGYSRNPIYLAFTLLHLGLALAYSSNATWKAASAPRTGPTRPLCAAGSSRGQLRVLYFRHQP